jgi:uncharacterized lipoprotein YbaY/heat shock protein HslJ
MLRPAWPHEIALSGVAVLLAGVTGLVAQTSEVIRGTATYRERIALPPDAVLEAGLEDVSKADVPAEVIATIRIENPGNPPFRFEISYDSGRIVADHRYSVRARIMVGGKPMFITDQSHPVLTGGHGHEVEILLRRAGSQPPASPGKDSGAAPMRGMYRHMADAGWFTDCATRVSHPVAQEGDNAALESAYGTAGRPPGGELLVTLEGRVAMRPKMEGTGEQAALVVERFLGVWPGETCGARGATDPLENTWWKLTRLGEKPVWVGEGQQEPYLILKTDRMEGSGGCNRMTGSYTLDGEKVAFGPIATTLMACLTGAETEKAFHEALGRAGTWKIEGQHLELLDAEGAMVARFEARRMK